MGIFQQFPYTNFHEMNLDQIIKIVKQLADDWVAYQLKWDNLYDDTTQALEDFKAYVQNYFDTLDLQEEVNTKLDEMLRDGVFDPLIVSDLSPVVTAWLADNITISPGVVIDSSLSIAGAAADAKATGAVKEIVDADQFVVDSLGDKITDITSASDTRLVTKIYLTHKGDVISFHPGTNVQDYLVEYYDNTTDYSHETGWISKSELSLDMTGYIWIRFRKPNNSSIAVSDYDADTFIVRNNRSINKLISDTGESDLVPVKHEDIIQGSYARDGSVTTAYNRIRLTDFVEVLKGDIVSFTPGVNAEGMLIGIVNENMQTWESAWTYAAGDYMIPVSGHMMLMFRRLANGDIAPLRYDADVVIKRKRAYRIGAETFNGNIFRCNNNDPIPYPVRTSSTYSVTYTSLINEYEKIRNRVTSFYSNVLSGVPKPKTITRTAIGTAGAYTLYKYVYTPAYPKKTVCLIAGTHGNEYEGIYSLLEMFKMICCGEYNYPQLDEIRENVKLIIIPVVDPYGFEHNTKLNADNENIYDQYPSTAPQSVEITAVKNTLASETIDFFMDMHCDPYSVRSQKGCYGYALTTGDMFEPLYKAIMKFREIVYSEFNYESQFLDANNKDVIVGPITDINGAGSTAYGERNGIPSILAEISTGYGWGGSGEDGSQPEHESFAPYGSSDMMRICIDFYSHVLMNAYKTIDA